MRSVPAARGRRPRLVARHHPDHLGADRPECREVCGAREPGADHHDATGHDATSTDVANPRSGRGSREVGRCRSAHHAQPHEIARDEPGRPARDGDEGGGDQRDRAADHGGRDLPGDRDAAPPDLGGKQFGEQRTARTGCRALDEADAEDQCQSDHPRRPRIEHHEHREREDDAEDRAGQQDRLAADLVGQSAEPDDDGDGAELGDDQSDQRLGGIDAEGLGHEREREDLHDVGPRNHEAEQGKSAQDLPPVVADRLDQRRAVHLAVLRGLLEHGGLVHLQPQIAGDENDDGAGQERNTPAPGQELVVGHQREQREDHGGAAGPDVDRGPRIRTGESAAGAVRGFGDHRDRPGELGARARTLEQAKHDEEDRRPDPDRVRGGQRTDQRCRGAHDEQGHEEHRLADRAGRRSARTPAHRSGGHRARRRTSRRRPSCRPGIPPRGSRAARRRGRPRDRRA